MVGAHVLHCEKNNLVVSLGTCITYNLIGKNKTFRGGAISPGNGGSSFNAPAAVPMNARSSAISSSRCGCAGCRSWTSATTAT